MPTAPTRLVEHAKAAWDEALKLGEKHGYRNAQATVIAPTGTIGLVMDCDTTGIEPDFRAGEVQEARRRRLLQDHQPRGARGAAHARLLAPPRSPRSRPMPSVTATLGRRRASTTRRRSRPRASADTQIEKINGALPPPSTSSSSSTSGRWARTCRWTCSASRRKAERSRPSTCCAPGLLQGRDRGRQHHVCGTMTLEGAPHLKEEHYPVFDCANPAARRASATCRSTATSA
jgi:ribonucleoside-diphosphate reductase alpha chain